MNLTTEIVGVVLLAFLFCIALLIRYALVGRTIMRNTEARLIKVEEEVHNHPLNCPLKQKASKEQSVALPPARALSIAEYFKTRLLTSAEATCFRTAFTAAYPTVLHRLRTLYPEVSRTDEMLCILIFLKHDNEEIAYLLGINRASVLTSRYRLRLKLKLPEGTDLDTEVRQLLSSEADVELSVKQSE